MKKWINPLLIVLGFVILIMIITNKKPETIYVEPKITQILEEQSTKEKEIIRETKIEVKQIENSKEYLDMRRKLDSLMINKDTSSFATHVCYETVNKQDSIISKQKVIITSQDKVISNDSIIKTQLNQTIEAKNNEVLTEKSKAKKAIWRGRAEGGGVGLIVGYILGKKI